MYLPHLPHRLRLLCDNEDRRSRSSRNAVRASAAPPKTGDTAMRDNRHINGTITDPAERRAIANARRRHPARKTEPKAEVQGVRTLLPRRRD